MADNEGPGCGCLILAGLIVYGIYSCSSGTSSSSEYYDDYSSDPDEYGYESREPFDEDAAREEAEEELAGEGYDYSYGCTIDCSGHEAGWEWRAENGYPTYGSYDYGNSESFAEGAMAYEEAVEERVDEMRDEYEDGEEPY